MIREIVNNWGSRLRYMFSLYGNTQLEDLFKIWRQLVKELYGKESENSLQSSFFPSFAAAFKYLRLVIFSPTWSTKLFSSWQSFSREFVFVQPIFSAYALAQLSMFAKRHNKRRSRVSLPILGRISFYSLLLFAKKHNKRRSGVSLPILDRFYLHWVASPS